MQALKTGLIALSVLALSSAALARGYDRGHGHSRHNDRYHGRYETRHVVVEKRYEPSCRNDRRVVYVPAKKVVVHERARVVVRPSVQIQVAWGF